MSPRELKDGYDWAYEEFYRWPSIVRASLAHGTIKHQAKHFVYASGWKKFERAWNLVIRARQLRLLTPLLEGVLSKVTSAREPDQSKALMPLPPGPVEMPAHSDDSSISRDRGAAPATSC